MLLIIIAALFLRVIFLSPFLEDWDSVQFALGMHHFSLSLHQPHPPGYPIYVFLGSFINLILQNDNLSLSLLSAILGSFMAIPFYLILQKITGKITAIFGTVVLLVIPIQWALSEVSLSNIPGMFFNILTISVVFLNPKRPKALYIASILAGFTLGVRFAEYSILICLLAFVLLRYRHSVKTIFVSLVLFFIGISIWLIPLIYITGLSEFLSLYIKQASYIKSHDSVVSISMIERIAQIKYLFKIAFGKIFYIVPISTAIFSLLKFKSYARNKEWQFGIVWFLSYFFPFLFVYNLEVPRHIFPLIPSLIFLFINSSEKLPRLISSLVLLTVILAIFPMSLKQVTILHKEVPPSIQPVTFIKNNYDPKNTTLLTTFVFRQTQYYASEFQNYYPDDSINAKISSKNVILDYLPTKDRVPALKNYTLVKTEEFIGDREVYPRLNKVTLFILSSNSSKP